MTSDMEITYVNQKKLPICFTSPRIRPQFRESAGLSNEVCASGSERGRGGKAGVKQKSRKAQKTYKKWKLWIVKKELLFFTY
jgi:hypothetical protein